MSENSSAGWTGGDSYLPDSRPATFRSFAREISGTTAIEYAMIALLMSLSLIAGATQTGHNLNVFFGKVVSAF